MEGLIMNVLSDLMVVGGIYGCWETGHFQAHKHARSCQFVAIACLFPATAMLIPCLFRATAMLQQCYVLYTRSPSRIHMPSHTAGTKPMDRDMGVKDLSALQTRDGGFDSGQALVLSIDH